MIKLDNRGRRANNEKMAEVLHSLNLGETINVQGSSTEIYRLANSLSRTHKIHAKTRLSVRALKTGGLKITCISNKKPKTIIIL